MKQNVLRIHPKDNVLVALQSLQAGERIVFEGEAITLLDEVPSKHKFNTSGLDKGAPILMYGTLVGRAKKNLPKGSLLTTENVAHDASEFSLKNGEYIWKAPAISKFENRHFLGYHRKDGQVGTANYWLVFPLVFCENRNIASIREAFVEELGFGKTNPYKQLVQQMATLYRKGDLSELESLGIDPVNEKPDNRLFKNIDGIKFLSHEGGCGGTRQDAEALCALLAGYVHNPNVAGATVLSLGCQHAQADILRTKLEAINPQMDKPLIVLEQQKEGTERELLTLAIKRTFLAMAQADKEIRKPAPLSKLAIGLECGGSDGFSGISANPAIGYTSDLVVALGGTTILSEFPELCGVEQELINRCNDSEIAGKFSRLMKTYAARAESVGSGFDMNPSPGNIRDGLITDAMKSSGAAKKGGTSPVADVLDYGEYIRKPGLNLLCTPGNDVESTSAMAGSGANIILFTTGLGTPTGNPITPVIKLSSNSALAKRMPDIIDIDTGGIISGERSIEEMGEEILEHIIQVASGNIKTKAMQLGQDDFIPWKRGVSL